MTRVPERGEAVPYEMTHVRIPLPLKSVVEALVTEYREDAAQAGVDREKLNQQAAVDREQFMAKAAMNKVQFESWVARDREWFMFQAAKERAEFNQQADDQREIFNQQAITQRQVFNQQADDQREMFDQQTNIDSQECLNTVWEQVKGREGPADNAVDAVITLLEGALALSDTDAATKQKILEALKLLKY